MNDQEQAIAEGIQRKLNEWSHGTERSAQTLDHRMGISDMGLCREYARHMVIQTSFDEGMDERDMWSANLGHAIEEFVVPRISGPVVEVRDDGTKVHESGHLSGMSVSVTLPSGKVLPGHPDLVLPGNNMVLDVKTTDGLTYPRREGASQQQKFQRRLYAAALIQMGVLDGSKPVQCGNVWFDRSARESTPVVQLEEYNDAMLVEIDEWLSDVDYAVMNKEQASLDKPFEWCRKACPFFMSCRGATGLVGDGGSIDDPGNEIAKAASIYAEGSALIKEGKNLQRDAKPLLTDVNGFVEGFAIKSTWIAETEIAGYSRAGYERLTITPVKS